MPFPANNKPRGGRREGSGRPPDWFKKKCLALITKKKILEFVCDVASGEHTETYYNRTTGIVEERPVDVATRLRAAEMLFDRGLGKPPQAIEAPGGTAPMFMQIVPAGHLLNANNNNKTDADSGD